MRVTTALALALAVYVLASVAWLAPLFAHFDSAVLYGPTDSVGALSDYWAAEQVGENPLTFDHNPYNGAPEGYPRNPTLAVANALQPLAFMALDGVLGDVGAWNLLTSAGFFLSALGMFALLWFLRFRLPTALLGGYVFGFGPWMFSRAYAGHAGMQHIWVLPLLFLALLLVHRSRRVGPAVLVGFLLAVAMYLHSYVGLMAGVLAASFLVLELLVVPARLRTIALGAAALGTALLLFSPPLWLYLQDRSGLRRSLAQPFSDLESGGATFLDYLLPSNLHPVLGSLRPDRLAGEHVLFWGYSLLVAAVAGGIVAVRGRRRLGEDERSYAGLLAIAAGLAGLLCSLKPVLQAGPVSLYTPSYAIGQAITFWRAYSRVGVVVALALIVLAAIAFDALLSRRRGWIFGAVGAGVLLFELAVEAPVPIWRTDANPPHVQWLRDHPGGIVAHYPLPIEKWALELGAEENWNVVKHGHPSFALWGGNNGGTREEALRILASNLTHPIGARVLMALGVKYVVVHEDVYRRLGLEVPAPGSVDIELLASPPGKRILGLHAAVPNLNRLLVEQSARIAAARAFPRARVERVAGWNDAEPYHDGQQWAWMIEAGRVVVRPAVDGPYFILFQAAANAAPRRLTVRVDGVKVGTARVETFVQRVRLGPFTFRGKTTVTFDSDPGPTQLGADRLGSVFMSPLDIRPAPAFYGRLNR